MAGKFAKDQAAGFVNQVKNVAIVGASGQLGTHIITALLKTGKHNVTAITRPDSQNTPPEGVNVAKVNYDDHVSLVKALEGQDALVITMFVLAPQGSIEKLVRAALEAKVPWILPNEWGSDYLDQDINRDTMLGHEHLATRKLIETEGKDTTAYIAVACGFWYDYSLVGGDITFGFDFGNKQATFYDDGKFKMRYSTLPYTGEAVANLLSLPVLPHDASDQGATLEGFRNTIMHVHAYELDQFDMLASVLRVTGDKESDWAIKYATAQSRYDEGKKRFQSGNRMGWRQMLYSRRFYPSIGRSKAEKYSDAKLGLKQPHVDEATRWALDQIKEQAE